MNEGPMTYFTKVRLGPGTLIFDYHQISNERENSEKSTSIVFKSDEKRAEKERAQQGINP